MLVGLAAFGINSSLLSFIPSSPQHGWRYVNQAVLMTLGSSTLVAVGALLLNAAFGGSLLGAHPWAVVIYVWLFTNFDFWEPLLIAEKQAYRVWGYTTGRLVCRLLVVTIAAALTKDVSVIVWSRWATKRYACCSLRASGIRATAQQESGVEQGVQQGVRGANSCATARRSARLSSCRSSMPRWAVCS